jgi:hypothetical protein
MNNKFKNTIINLKKRIFKVNWYNLRSLEPISKVFGLDRGTPIDRVYIENFLENNKQYINGVVCEISTNLYSKKYSNNVSKYEVMHYTNDNPQATIIGDLTDLSSLPEGNIDCFILTQTLNFIYDFKLAIKGVHRMLNKGGFALVTVAGISQISRHDMERWGDFYRFTDLSIKRAFEDIFGKGNIEVKSYGNILTSIAFLQGISAEELTKKEIFHQDNDYQVIITILARK